MKFDHISKEEFCYVACIIYFVAWYKMCHFAKTIHYDKNKIKYPMGLG